MGGLKCLLITKAYIYLIISIIVVKILQLQSVENISEGTYPPGANS